MVQRTASQNNSLHRWFALVADELNSSGNTVQLVLKEKMDLNWNPRLVKELLWRTAQQALLGKQSTTDLEKQMDIDLVWEHINRHLGEKFGVHVAFPHDPDKISNSPSYDDTMK